MAIYDVSEGKLRPLQTTTFAHTDVRERDHLQQLLKKQIEVISPDTLVISEEFSNWQDSRRRIDLLGVNRDGNLVVIELKRDEDGGHMELQALRYAAMVSSLTFDQAVEIFQDYLDSLDTDSQVDARSRLLEFLDWESDEENQFAQEVQIVLASAEFSKEITTTVLWLNNNGLDIRCVRLKPYLDGQRLLVDIQQVIPLPEAEAYQIQMKNKSRLEQVARRQERDLTKYIVTKGDQRLEGLPKRRAVFHFVKGLYEAGTQIESIRTAMASRRDAFRVLEGELPAEELENSLMAQQRSDGIEASPRRWFIDDDEVMRQNGKTYVLTKMWGRGTEDTLQELAAAFPDSGITYQAMR